VCERERELAADSSPPPQVVLEDNPEYLREPEYMNEQVFLLTLRV
jgi:hypothetical protein